MKSIVVRMTAAAVLLAAWQPVGAVDPFTLGGPGVDPDDFRVTVFAEGLDFPFGMQQLSDGSLLVATSDPGAGSSYFASTGKLRRFVDADLNGVADAAGTVVADSLPSSLTALRVFGDLAAVMSNTGVITVLRQGTTPADTWSSEGPLTVSGLSGWLHPPSSLSVRDTPGVPGSYDVLFQLGSKANFVETTDTATIDGLGLVSETLQGDSLYLVRLTDGGTSVTASNLTQIADGLRNPAGHAFHPATGDLYFQDNGIDTPGNSNEAFSPDELNRIAASDIGGAVENFGFPNNYIVYRTGAVVGGAGVQAELAFHAIPIADGEESEGAVQLAFAPDSFPDGLDDGLFVGFHGRFNLAGTSNEENPLVFVDLSDVTPDYFHFVTNDELEVGHPNGLLATTDSLFVSDMSATGGISPGVGAAGVIYQILVVPEPSTLALLGFALLAVTGRRRR